MADAPPTRASLLVRLRDYGDGPAWAQFVDLYAPLIYGYFRRHALQDADAADLTQEVLARVARAIRRLDYDPERGTFRGWLFTVVRNQWRTWSARPGLAPKDVPLDGQLAGEPDRAWEEDYRRRLFDWAADQVRPAVAPATWQAFWRTSIEGQGAAEAARQLGMSVAAVYMAKSRVLARLKVVLHDAEGAPWDA